MKKYLFIYFLCLWFSSLYMHYLDNTAKQSLRFLKNMSIQTRKLFSYDKCAIIKASLISAPPGGSICWQFNIMYDGHICSAVWCTLLPSFFKQLLVLCNVRCHNEYQCPQWNTYSVRISEFGWCCHRVYGILGISLWCRWICFCRTHLWFVM